MVSTFDVNDEMLKQGLTEAARIANPLTGCPGRCACQGVAAAVV
jgi:hypothetical protein